MKFLIILGVLFSLNKFGFSSELSTQTAMCDLTNPLQSSYQTTFFDKTCIIKERKFYNAKWTLIKDKNFYFGLKVDDTILTNYFLFVKDSIFVEFSPKTLEKILKVLKSKREALYINRDDLLSKIKNSEILDTNDFSILPEVKSTFNEFQKIFVVLGVGAEKADFKEDLSNLFKIFKKNNLFEEKVFTRIIAQTPIEDFRINYKNMISYLKKSKDKQEMSEETFFSYRSSNSSIHFCTEKVIEFLSKTKKKEKSQSIALQYVGYLYEYFQKEPNFKKKENIKNIILEISQNIISPDAAEYSDNQKMLAELMKTQLFENEKNTSSMYFSVINHYLNSITNESDPIKKSEKIKNLEEIRKYFINDDTIEDDYKPENSAHLSSLSHFLFDTFHGLRKAIQQNKKLGQIIFS